MISLDDAPYYRRHGELGVKSALTTTLDLSPSVRDSYTIQLAVDRKPNDVQTLVGVRVKL